MEIHTSLYPFMYHGQNKLPFHPNINDRNKVKKDISDKEDETKETLIVKRMNVEFDSLFWLFYYIKEGEDKYILHKNDFKEKQRNIYFILENILSYKTFFTKYSYFKKNNMVEKLTGIDHDDIDLLVFSFLCCINNIIVLVKNKQFYFTNYPNFVENKSLKDDEIDFFVKKYVL